MCSNYQGITQLSLHEIIYSRALERRLHLIIGPIQEEQCGFKPGCGRGKAAFSPLWVCQGDWKSGIPAGTITVQPLFSAWQSETIFGVQSTFEGDDGLYKHYNVTVLIKYSHIIGITIIWCIYM